MLEGPGVPVDADWGPDTGLGVEHVHAGGHRLNSDGLLERCEGAGSSGSEGAWRVDRGVGPEEPAPAPTAEKGALFESEALDD